MSRSKRLIAGCLVMVLLTGWSAPSFAASEIRDVFEDAFYGGLAGTLIGAACLAFTKTPGDHLDYMGYGAAGGVLAGTAFGIFKVTRRAIAEYENGRVRFAMPTVIPDLQEASSRGPATLALKAELFRGTF
jgi:hypothetical protein